MDNKTYSPPHPHATPLEVLKGFVSKPIETISNKPDYKGHIVKVSLVKEGSGIIGLENAADNQEWAGIFNHILKTARVATFLGEQLREKGEVVVPDCILNTILVSHAGRRQYDEATWYPSVVPNAHEKVEAGDTAITLELLSNARISPTIVENVKAHGVGDAYPITQMDTWEKILPSYADFRVSQHVISLQTERSIFSKLQIKPEHITDNNPSTPWWERYLRRLYINDAEKEIFANISQFFQELEKEETNMAEFNRDFLDSWWGKYVRDLYEAQRGIPYQQTNKKGRNKAVGIERAIGFFGKLDSQSAF